MLPSFSSGGDDDYFGGSNTLVLRPIAREDPSGSDYRQWRRSLRRRLEGGCGREQGSLPLGEKRSKLSGPPPLGGETRECSDDERLQTRLQPGCLREAAREARKEEEAPVAAPLGARHGN